eukprot:6175811-Karenia_brevis.AAC.1
MYVADPPFQTDDIDCKVSSALVTLLNAVERVRPRLILGQGQGGTVAAAATFPLILERACRDRA